MTLSESFAGEIEKLMNLSRGNETSKRAELEDACGKLYALMGKRPPALVFCRSPYQFVTIPSLLIGMFFSDAWQVISHAFIGRDDEHWRDDFDEAFDTLWAHGGQQLLRGMKQTSRIGSLYWQLESELFKQCRSELAAWIKSGKLTEFEESLPKQIVYRQFWAMHLWHLNFMQDHVRSFAASFSEGLCLEKALWCREWEEFAPHYERFLRLASAYQNAILSPITRMGAEPDNQAKHAICLPVTVPVLALARIWIELVNRDAFKAEQAEIAIWSRIEEHALAVLCLDHVVFALEKPEILSVDRDGRLHNESGVSLSFSDGFHEYCWHGVPVDSRIILEPDSISVDEIEGCRNLEIRRVLMERYGQSRYLQDSGALEIHRDEYGILFRKEIPGDEDLVMVKVVNSSPEPDGSFRDYFLRVPPDLQTAHQAVAWTFGFDEEDYKPERET